MELKHESITLSSLVRRALNPTCSILICFSREGGGVLAPGFIRSLYRRVQGILRSLFPKIQADPSSWLGTKKCFVLLCPIGELFLLSSFRAFVHDGYFLDRGLSGSCTTEMHAVRKLSVWYKIPNWFQNTVCPKTKYAFPKIQAWAYNRYSPLHGSRLA